jgi:hypothetical protein
MHKNTFGKTPAAIYLADRLNILNDPKYTRKISSIIHRVQSVMADSIKASEVGLLSTKTLNFIIARLRRDVEDASNTLINIESYVGSGGYLMPDQLSANLMSNILIGELKSATRRCRKVKLLKHKQQQLVGRVAIDASLKSEILLKKITIRDVKDPTTPEFLIERSRAKLKRKGKVNSLYGEDTSHLSNRVHSCDIPGCAVCDPTYGL